MSDTTTNKPHATTLARNALLLLLVVIVLVDTVRLVSRNLQPLEVTSTESDSWAFAEMTRTFANGRRLYVDYWDTKPPGLFFFTAPYVLIFGNTLQALQIATLSYIALFVVSIGGLVHAVTHSKTATAAAVLLALDYSGRQRGLETTFLMTSLGTLATWGVVLARGRLVPLLLSGMVFALGVATKQPLTVAFPALVAFAVWFAPNRRRQAFVGSVAGVAIGGALLLGWAWQQGILDVMLYRVIEISRQYVVADDGLWHFRSDSGALFATFFLGQTWPDLWPLVLLALLAVVVLWRNRRERGLVGITLLWVLLSVGGAAIPRALKADYFTQTYPPFILLICLAVPLVVTFRRWVQVACVGLAVVLAIVHAPDGLTNQPMPTAETQALVDFVAASTTSDDCIWTWGNLPFLNFLAGRDSCASAYLNGFMMDHTTFPIKATRVENMHEMLAAHPALHIDDHIWGYYPQLQHYADRYLGELIYESGPYAVYTVDRSMWHEADVNFGDEIRFVGYDLLPVDGPVCPGDTLTLAMTWQQIRTPAHQYQMFVQLLTQDEQARVAGYDGPPEDDRRSNATNTWVDTGEYRLGERFDLPIDADAEPGAYKLVVGLYDVETAERLPVLDATGAPAGSYAVLQNVDVARCDG